MSAIRHARPPAELLQQLIRFDTTNPPGNEAPIIAFLADMLAAAGLETTILARDPARPNLLARLPGRGGAPPLLLYGHVDVVTTEGQAWSVPPFEGRVADGCIWGRGALDMKGAVAMYAAALLRAVDEGLAPAGDLLFAATADEEVDTGYGVRYLVDEHAGLFESVRYAVSESGAFSLPLGRGTLYPVMVGEKQTCALRATVRGPGGHGSVPVRGGAMARLGALLRRLDRHRLPVHLTPTVGQMIEGFASVLPSVQARILRLLLRPRLTDRILDLIGAQGTLLSPLLHNTASPTVVHAGKQINVIPSEVAVLLDGRLLPGQGPDDMLRELHALLDPVVPGVEIEVTRYEPGPPEPDMGLFDTLSQILRQADPGGTPVPMLMPAVTDARHFARLGIQTYGYTPMKLPAALDFWKLIHAADERVPVDALEFGTDCVYRLLQQYGN
ncbi:MAG: M20/M25/M40 family metallo-hydrolase [Anaerolineae bacterium]|nr:M20/M25/M40 family metallo-hydrolase [Anaerolineae bacterium]